MSMNRRHFLTASGLLLTSWTPLACSQNDEDNSTVTVYTWWTGSEAAALASLAADFTKRNPHIKYVNQAVGGGSGERAKAELAPRLKAGNPPDTFQGHAGAELSDYIKADQLEDISFLYIEEEGWKQAFPDNLRMLLRQGGSMYSMRT